MLTKLRLARLKEVELRCDRLRHENSMATNESVSRQEVSDYLKRIGLTLRMELVSGCETTLPPALDGLPAMQIRLRLREWYDRVLDVMRDTDYNVGPTK